MVFPFLVLYFHRTLNLDLDTAAGIVAFYGIGSGCAAPLGGWLADRFDAVRVLAATMATAGLFLVFFPWVRQPILLMLGTFCIALAYDLARPSSLTALARLGGESQSRDAFTVNYLAINIGMSIGPILGGYLALRDYRYLFWFDGASSILAAGVLWASGTRCPAVEATTVRPDWNIGRSGFRMLFWFALSLWVFMTMFTATPIYLVEVLHRPESWVGWVWLVNTGLVVFTTVHVNHWTREKPLSLQLCAAALLFSVGYAVLLVSSRIYGLVACMIFLTVGEMLLFTNANTYLRAVVADHKMGRAMALLSMASSLALACSTPVVGYFFTARTPRELWAILSLAGLVAAWGYYGLPAPEPRVSPEGPTLEGEGSSPADEGPNGGDSVREIPVV